MKYFDGHQAPISSLNLYEEQRWIITTEIFSNRNERSRFVFQATSCCDGAVKIFSIDKQTLIKQLNVISKSNDIASIFERNFDWMELNLNVELLHHW